MTAIGTIGNASLAGKSDLDRLRGAVGEVVGSVFYGTLLKTMRESELKGPIGHGGRGEEIFAAQLHGMMAERMGKATRGGLADALYNSMEHQQRLISELRSTA
ncbi:MAG: rod-binding protein [Planctomycetota bacterium]|jgi:Rod binding domain-containing protein